MSEEEYFTEEELERIATNYEEMKVKLSDLLMDNDEIAKEFFDNNVEIANDKVEKILDLLTELVNSATGYEISEEEESEEDESEEEEKNEE